jgi:hypothetical protein
MREEPMNKTRLYIIAALVAGAAILLISKYVDFSGTPDLPRVKNGADEIRIRSTAKNINIKLIHRDGRWFVADSAYPGNAAFLDALVKKLGAMKIAEQITAKENYARYDLDTDRAMEIELLSGGKKLRHVRFGKSAQNQSMLYAGIEGEKGVFLVEGIRMTDLPTDETALRDKTILTFVRADIEKIRAQGQAYSFTLLPVKDGDKTEWKVDGGVSDTGKAETFAAGFDAITADRFLETKPSGTPLVTITVSAKGADTTLAIYPKDAEGYYPAVTSAVGYPFLLSEAKATRYLKKPADLRP